jgi:hypothetical protein
MERNLTEEEFKILKMLIAKGINGVKKDTLSTLSEDDKIQSYEERANWLIECKNIKSKPNKKSN